MTEHLACEGIVDSWGKLVMMVATRMEGRTRATAAAEGTDHVISCFAQG